MFLLKTLPFEDTPSAVSRDVAPDREVEISERTIDK